jgi:hypothetical protein
LSSAAEAITCCCEAADALRVAAALLSPLMGVTDRHEECDEEASLAMVRYSDGGGVASSRC